MVFAGSSPAAPTINLERFVMSTVVLSHGKLYADSQGTNSETGEKFFDTNKLFKVGKYHCGVTGTLNGWEHFKAIKLERNPFKKVYEYVKRLYDFREDTSSVIQVDVEKNIVYTHDHRWYGWRTRKFSTKVVTHMTMGSGVDAWDELDRELFYDDVLTPEWMITKAMKHDEYSGGRIVIL